MMVILANFTSTLGGDTITQSITTTVEPLNGYVGTRSFVLYNIEVSLKKGDFQLLKLSEYTSRYHNTMWYTNQHG